jgi:hypothetical protein
MSRVERLYRWLAGDVGPDTNRVLAEALSRAEPAYAGQIVAILLGRRHETAWAGLVGNYDRLLPEARAKMLGRPNLLRAGIMTAMRSPNRRFRHNTLALLADYPAVRLAYLAADALRDPDRRTRELAARALQQNAGHLLAFAERGGEFHSDRAEFVRALTEALRTFEIHGRAEVLQTCLWFARDLGASLWDLLRDPRARCGPIVADRLKAWNHPRLASFLLLALAHPQWRGPALKMLGSWQEKEELIALLRNTDLVSDPEIRSHLHTLRHPRWVILGEPDLTELPADAREWLPMWICWLGFTDDERVRCLERWLHSPLPEVQRSAVYAMAMLDLPQSERHLTRVAAENGPMAQFARWYVAGRQAMTAQIWADDTGGQKQGSKPTAGVAPGGSRVTP